MRQHTGVYCKALKSMDDDENEKKPEKERCEDENN
jgi:hypothetical protein